MPSYIMGQGSERIREILLGMNQTLEISPQNTTGYGDGDKQAHYFIFDISIRKMLLIKKDTAVMYVSQSMPSGWITIEEGQIAKFLNVMQRESKLYEETTEEKTMKAFR
jgi:hypothetical protein